MPLFSTSLPSFPLPPPPPTVIQHFLDQYTGFSWHFFTAGEVKHLFPWNIAWGQKTQLEARGLSGAMAPPTTPTGAPLTPRSSVFGAFLPPPQYSDRNQVFRGDLTPVTSHPGPSGNSQQHFFVRKLTRGREASGEGRRSFWGKEGGSRAEASSLLPVGVVGLAAARRPVAAARPEAPPSASPFPPPRSRASHGTWIPAPVATGLIRAPS